MKKTIIISMLFVRVVSLYANETPKKATAVIYEPYGGDWDIGDHSGPCRSACEHHSYSITSYIQTNAPGSNPPRNFTVVGFIENIVEKADDYGIIWIHSYGCAGLLSVEPYTGSNAKSKAKEQARAYFNTFGWDDDSIDVRYIDMNTWEISVTGNFIKNRFNTTSKPLIYVKSCGSALTDDDYGNICTSFFISGVENEAKATEVVGYDASYAGIAGADIFWKRMDGRLNHYENVANPTSLFKKRSSV
jgi:hypothetical protein